MATKQYLRAKTPLGDKLLFEEMTGRESLGAPFEYQLSLLSADEAIDLSALLGQPLTVEMDMPGDKIRYFNGYVGSASFAGLANGLARYHVTLRPWFWLLTLGANCRIFQNKTVVEIAQEIFEERGFNADVRSTLHKEYRKWEYSVQYRESDFNYISRLFEQEGIYYYFEHADGKHTLVLAEGADSHLENPGFEKVPFYGAANPFDTDHLAGWTVGRHLRPGVFAATDYDFTKPRADLSAKLKQTASHPRSDAEIYDYPGEYRDSAEGRAQVQVRLEEHQADGEVVNATGNVRGLLAGSLFKLERYPREDQNKQYLVVSATVHAGPISYASGAPSSNEYKGSYGLISGKTPYRPRAGTPKPRVEGPQTAVVVGKKGEEIWTDEHGRVKIQFHWDRLGASDEKSSCWVRVAQVWAGSGFGGIHLPRMGQEVIVEFLEGDPDRPIVTGRVYNGDNMPPYALPDNKTQSGVKSRSSKGGSAKNANEIRFEDKKGAEEMYLQAEKDQKTYVKNDQSILVDRNREQTVKGERKTKVTKKDTVLLEDEHETTVVKKVKQHYRAEHELAVDGPQKIWVTNDKTEHITKNYELTTDERFQLEQGGTKLEFKGNKVALDAAGAVTITRGPAKVSIDLSGKVVIDTPAGITFSCGPSSITVTMAGVEVKGPQVEVKSVTGSAMKVDPVGAHTMAPLVNVTAQAICSIKGLMLHLNGP